MQTLHTSMTRKNHSQMFKYACLLPDLGDYFIGIYKIVICILNDFVENNNNHTIIYRHIIQLYRQIEYF